MIKEQKDIIHDIEKLIEPVLSDHGLELYDIELKGRGRNSILRIFIDKTDGVTIDDCATVSREFGPIMDIHDVISSSYTLEISSPGLNRALKKPGDYLRFKGKKLKIITKTDIDDRKLFIGKLVEFADEIVSVESDGVSYQIPYSQIEKAKLELDF